MPLPVVVADALTVGADREELFEPFDAAARLLEGGGVVRETGVEHFEATVSASLSGPSAMPTCPGSDATTGICTSCPGSITSGSGSPRFTGSSRTLSPTADAMSALDTTASCLGFTSTAV